MFAALLATSLVGKIPPMRIVAYGLTIQTVASACSGISYWVNSYWFLITARCFTGVGEAAFCAIIPAVIDDKAPPAKKVSKSIFYNT